jgi:hypothetical protein
MMPMENRIGGISAVMPWIAMAGRQYVPAWHAVRISFPLDYLISVYYAGRYLGFEQVDRYVVDRIIPFFIHHSYSVFRMLFSS